MLLLVVAAVSCGDKEVETERTRSRKSRKRASAGPGGQLEDKLPNEAEIAVPDTSEYSIAPRYRRYVDTTSCCTHPGISGWNLLRRLLVSASATSAQRFSLVQRISSSMISVPSEKNVTLNRRHP